MPDKTFIDKLFDALSELVDSSPELRKEIISENKIDLGSINSKVNQHLKRLRMEEKKERLQELKNNVVALKRQFESSPLRIDREKIEESLRSLLGVSADNASFATFYREFESLDESEMGKILSDAEILKVIQEELAPKDDQK